MEFGLDVKLGAEGFAVFEKLLAGELDLSTVLAKSSGLSMTLTDAAPASRAFQRLLPLAIDSKNKVRVGDRRGYLTGWRRGEILTLTWADVDRGGGLYAGRSLSPRRRLYVRIDS